MYKRQPKPCSAVSSKSELDQAGPFLELIFTVYGDVAAGLQMCIRDSLKSGEKAFKRHRIVCIINHKGISCLLYTSSLYSKKG